MSKLVRSNGRLLEVFDLGPLIERLNATRGPIKLHGVFIVDDAIADNWIRQLADAQSDPVRWRIGGRRS